MGSTRSVRRVPRAVVLFAGVAGLAVLAAAQPGQGVPQADPARQPPFLRGPSVDETAIPGTDRAFSMEGAPDGPEARMLNREIPMPEFMAAFRALNAPDTPENLNLSSAQRQTLGEIAGEHARAMGEYLSQHRDELTALGATLGFEPDELTRGERAFAVRPPDGERRARGDAGTQPDGAARIGRAGRAAGQPGRSTTRDASSVAGTPPARGPADLDRRVGRSPEQVIRERVGDNPTPEQRQAIARLREIRTAGPSALEAQTRAWNALSEPQQQFVQAHLDQARVRMQARRGEMYVQDMVEQRGAARLAPGTPGAPAGEAAARLHRLIDSLTPGEQAMLLRLLENRLPELRARATGQGEPGGRPDQPRGPARRPEPPPIDQIDVPAADPI